MLSPPAGSNALGVFMTRSSLDVGENLVYWLMVAGACVVFLFEARRARSNTSLHLQTLCPFQTLCPSWRAANPASISLPSRPVRSGCGP